MTLAFVKINKWNHWLASANVEIRRKTMKWASEVVFVGLTHHCGTCPQTGTSESDSIGTCFGSSFGSYSVVHIYRTPAWGEWSGGRNPTRRRNRTLFEFILKNQNSTHSYKHFQNNQINVCFKYQFRSVLYPIKSSPSILSSYLVIKRARNLCTLSKAGASGNSLAAHSQAVFVLICPWIRRGFLS